MIVVWEGTSNCGGEEEDPVGYGGTSVHSRRHLLTSRAHPCFWSWSTLFLIYQPYTTFVYTVR